METSSDDLQKRPRIANPDTLAQSADYGIATGATQLLSSGGVHDRKVRICRRGY